MGMCEDLVLPDHFGVAGHMSIPIGATGALAMNCA